VKEKRLRTQGLTAIVAHSERYRFFTKDPARLRALVAAGAWLQVTVDSLLGNYGQDPQASGEALLRAYAEAVLATDTPTSCPDGVFLAPIAT
jgi:protein-tyrosine phosphatase